MKITATTVRPAQPHWGFVWNDYFRNDPEYERSRTGVALYLGRRGLSLTWRKPKLTPKASEHDDA